MKFVAGSVQGQQLRTRNRAGECQAVRIGQDGVIGSVDYQGRNVNLADLPVPALATG